MFESCHPPWWLHYIMSRQTLHQWNRKFKASFQWMTCSRIFFKWWIQNFHFCVLEIKKCLLNMYYSYYLYTYKKISSNCSQNFQTCFLPALSQSSSDSNTRQNFCVRIHIYCLKQSLRGKDWEASHALVQFQDGCDKEGCVRLKLRVRNLF